MKKHAQGPSVLIFGEGESDGKAIKHLLEALRPDLAGRVHTRRDPISFMKNVTPEEIPERAQRLARLIEDDVACVFLHEDCDAVEPAHERGAKKIEDAMKGAGCDVHAVTPAWEMEAWWFLFPDAVKAANPSWRRPDDYVGKHVGLIRNAKEELKRCVKPPKAKPTFRGYQESDAPKIAEQVKVLKLAESPQGTSGSYARFRASVSACLRSSVPAPSPAASSPAPAAPAARELSRPRRQPRIVRRG